MIWEILRLALSANMIVAVICLICEMAVVGRALYYGFDLNAGVQLCITILVSFTPGINILISVYDFALVLCTKPLFISKTSKVIDGKYPEDIAKPVRTEDGKIIGYLIDMESKKDSDSND